jgi:hypothetical protein
MVSNLLMGRQIRAIDDESDTTEILEEEFQIHGADLTRSLFTKTQSDGSLP